MMFGTKERKERNLTINDFLLSKNFLSLPMIISDFQEKRIDLEKNDPVFPLAALLTKYFNELNKIINKYIKLADNEESISLNEIEMAQEKFRTVYEALTERARVSNSHLEYEKMGTLAQCAKQLIEIIKRKNAESNKLAVTESPQQDRGELRESIADLCDSESYKKAQEDALNLIGTRIKFPSNNPQSVIANILAIAADKLRDEMPTLKDKVLKAEEPISLFEIELALGKYEASYDAYEQDAKVNVPHAKDWSMLKELARCARELIEIVKSNNAVLQQNVTSNQQPKFLNY
jgi:hypothetical protein